MKCRISIKLRNKINFVISSVIRVINKIGRPRSGSPICLITSMITDRIGRHEVLLPNSLSSGVAEIGASGTVTKEISQKIVLLPIAPKFGTQAVNRFCQSPA